MPTGNQALGTSSTQLHLAVGDIMLVSYHGSQVVRTSMVLYMNINVPFGSCMKMFNAGYC